MQPPSLGPGTVVQVRPDLLFHELDGEVVALNLESGQYYGLNEVGSRIWCLLQSPQRLGIVHEVLLGEYDVPADALWRDLESLVAELLRHGLAEIHA